MIKNFTEISKTDVSIAGGKGASLGEMTKAGILVPSGFVILAEAFELFLKETDLNVEINSILHTVKHKEIHTIEAASEKIQALILQAKVPNIIVNEMNLFFKKLNAKFVAVRSSATAEDSASAAWAGQLESYLNTGKKDLLDNVKKCWASLFTPRAIFYRFEKNLHKQKISVAVVVQKMVASEKSGIAFSVHPITQDRNQLIIEAGFGLGEAVVSGQITPDAYVVEKQPRRIIDVNIQNQERGLFRGKNSGNVWRQLPAQQGKKQVLSEREILALTEIILRIENHYDFPCDVEWAFEKGKFYIVQSRPITTLSKENKVSFEENNKNLIEKAKKLDWKHWLERPYGPFIATLNFSGVDKKYFERVGLRGFGYNANLYQFPNYYYSEKLAEINRQALNKYFAEKTIFDISKILIDVHNKNKKEMRLLIDKKLNSLEKLLRAREILKTYFPFLWIIIPLEEHYNNLIAKNVPKYIKRGVSKFVGDASIPIKLNEYGKMLKMLRLNRQIKLVHKKFAWLKSRDGFTDFYTIKELAEIKKNLNDEEKKHQVKIPKQLKKLFAEIQQLTFFRTDRTDKYYEMLGLVRPIFIEVANSINISFKELENYSADSIFRGSPQKINKPYNYLYIDGKQIITYDPIISVSTNLKGKVKGTPAFKGIVRGIVKIVCHPSELNKINYGDILVSQMTLPSFISAMQKASAFVTDEGSITCHAAIVAREMKKPCIIGTKIATKVFKDGDLVEVDANNGIVRIIKKFK